LISVADFAFKVQWRRELLWSAEGNYFGEERGI